MLSASRAFRENIEVRNPGEKDLSKPQTDTILFGVLVFYSVIFPLVSQHADLNVLK